MRFNNKIAPLWGAAGLCSLILSGCGPKEEVASAPADTVIVNNPTPEPGKITIESKPPEVIVKDDKMAPDKTSSDKKSDKMAPDKMSDTPPVRSENKMESDSKSDGKMPKPDKKMDKPAKKDASLPEPADAPKKLVPIPKNATKMIVEDIKVGTGKRAEPGTNLSMEYTGTLTNGTVFDSNVGKGEPFTFMLGSGQVIKGWDNGLVGMKVGGKRRLIIPPDMGYGDRDMGKIPPNSTLVFTVELLDVQ